MLLTAILVASVVSLLLIALVAGLSLRKRFANRDPLLIGESGRVETALTPEGTVIVRSELWVARSTDGLVIASQRRIRVVGVDDLSLLVEAYD
jgi:membrane-bound ClpP family serine protease